MPTIHLPIGTSSVNRLINCPASFNRIAKAPEQKAGSAAQEGTLLHTIMEKHYEDTPAITLIDKVELDGLTFTKEMYLEQVSPALEATEKALDLMDGDELILEQFVQYIPDLAGGTLDMIAVSGDGATILLNDYKFGYNGVKAANNSQILMAALSASVDPATSEMMEHAERFLGSIVQPKVYGDTPDTWWFTRKDIEDFKTLLDLAIEESKRDDATAKTGAHCMYCAAAPYCPEKKQIARASLVLSKDDSKQLAEAMALVDEVEAWGKAVKKAAHEALEKGGRVEGWKLVNKRATRVWTDPEAVEKRIRNAKKIKLEDGFTYKLKSPAQLEKACKEKSVPWKPYAENIAHVSSGTTLAPEGDKRPSVQVKEIPDVLTKLVALS